jgi:hypothetical protein
MAKTASLGAVADAQSARADYEAMEVIALTDLKWLPSADLPAALRSLYKTFLSNIDINASKLVDGSPDGYFVFLGSKLAPLWQKDLEKIRGVAQASPLP